MRWAVARGTRARALSALAGVVIVGAGIAIWSAGGPDGDRTETDVPDVSTTVTGAVTEPTLDTDATAGSVSVGTDISGSTPPTSVGADGGTATPPTGGAPAVSSTRAGDGTGSTGPAAPTSSVPLSTLPPVPGATHALIQMSHLGTSRVRLTAYASDATKPALTTTDLRPSPQVSFALVPLGPGGTIRIDSEDGPVRFLADVIGYVVAPPPPP